MVYCPLLRIAFLRYAENIQAFGLLLAGPLAASWIIWRERSINLCIWLFNIAMDNPL
jgi:hypothetical protein